MRHEARLFFPLSQARADAIALALAPESAQNEVPKTRGEARSVAGGLEVVLHADDLPSLRATVNSHLRWVDAAMRAAAVADA